MPGRITVDEVDSIQGDPQSSPRPCPHVRMIYKIAAAATWTSVIPGTAVSTALTPISPALRSRSSAASS
jgi:hypothetical protein